MLQRRRRLEQEVEMVDALKSREDDLSVLESLRNDHAVLEPGA